jgi:hypothetical protein
VFIVDVVARIQIVVVITKAERLAKLKGCRYGFVALRRTTRCARRAPPSGGCAAAARRLRRGRCRAAAVALIARRTRCHRR